MRQFALDVRSIETFFESVYIQLKLEIGDKGNETQQDYIF